MAEYIERETTVRMAVEAATEIFDCHTTLPLLKVANKIRTIPTADVVEVVRCKDCKHSTLIFGTYICDNIQSPWFNDDFDVDVGANDFCSFGIKKEGAEK